MPKFKITMTFPDNEGESFEKEIFITEKEFVKRFLPLYHESNFNIHRVQEVPSVFDKQVISARLDSGREVELLKFSFHLTYGDLIEGDPDQNYHEYILEKLQTNFSKGHIPTHIRMPSEDRITGELPVFYGVAEWANYNKNHEERRSSKLRVVWFMDTLGDGLTFREMLEQSLRGLDWEHLAEKEDPLSL